MVSATLSQSASANAPPIAGLNVAPRQVWARLMAGALLASACAWLVATLAPLRSVFILSHDGEAIGLTLTGVAVIAAPWLIWAWVRVFVRAPGFFAGVFYWLFMALFGFAANTLFFLAIEDSMVSVFVLAGLGFGAVSLSCRAFKAPPALFNAAIFASVGFAGAFMIAQVLPSAWPFIVADIAGVTLGAMLIWSRSHLLQRMQDRFESAPRDGGLIGYGALAILSLVEPSPPTSPALT